MLVPDLKKEWDDLAQHHWKALWTEARNRREAEEARTALLRFFNALEGELVQQRTALEGLREEVEDLRRRAAVHSSVSADW